MNLATKNRYLGEMKFLRAMYYFRLLRVYGGVPLVDFTIPSSANWKQPRASAVQIYNFIEKDLKEANDVLWLKNDPRYADTDLGRATKGAAQAMLLKLNLYRAGWVKSGLLKNDEQTPDYYYREAKRWGDSIINSGVYSLCANYNDNFTVMGENGPESVFEIQYNHEPAGDNGKGNGFSRGTFTVILIRSRSSLISNPTGWSFNRPSMDLYREFEAGDRRREVAILMPRPDQIENPTLDIYCGDSCLNNKYALYQGSPDSTFYRLGHAARGPINTKVIRYADVLLMHAEACLETGDLATPIKVINQLRQRARDYAGDQSILPDQSASDYTTATQLLRHERRCELAMEAHRWFDLVRWGVAKEVMDAYKAKESPEARAEMAEFISGKHELFPIPLKEIELNPMEQNPGYN
jgi:hypothetical protein